MHYYLIYKLPMTYYSTKIKQKAEAVTLLPFAVVVMLFFIYPLGHDLIIALKTEYASSDIFILPYNAN